MLLHMYGWHHVLEMQSLSEQGTSQNIFCIAP